MRQRLHQLIRDLHLYVGLFLSPFVLLFAVSVLFFVHGRLDFRVTRPGHVALGLAWLY